MKKQIQCSKTTASKVYNKKERRYLAAQKHAENEV